MMTNRVFWDALLEAAYMWIFVFLSSPTSGVTGWAAPWPRKSPALRTAPSSTSSLLHAAPCSSCAPTMSAVAAILFSVLMGGGSWAQLPAYWVATVLKNFPMAPVVEPVRRRAGHPAAVPAHLPAAACRA